MNSGASGDCAVTASREVTATTNRQERENRVAYVMMEGKAFIGSCVRVGLRSLHLRSDSLYLRSLYRCFIPAGGVRFNTGRQGKDWQQVNVSWRR